MPVLPILVPQSSPSVRGACSITISLALWAWLMVGAVHAEQTPGLPPSAAILLDHEPIRPVPFPVDLEPDKVALGERLFHDPRLSRDNTTACITCHQLAQGGDDGRPQAITGDGILHRRNTPTIFNVALNTRYHWDGAIRTLEAEAEAALHSPGMMQTTWPEVLAKLRAEADYVNAFNAIYPGSLQAAHVLDALATYERSLLTPNARFDHYLRGQPGSLTAAEKRGYELFKAYGCAACHQGVNVGGNMFQKFGIFEAERASRDDADDDPGRFAITGAARDRRVFRVPGLRNVGVTAPYYHDGRVTTLESAVDLMARRQLDKILTSEEINLIVQFLLTLTGEYQGRSLAPAPEEPR